MMSRPAVFISYSHQDEEWKDRLVTHLGVLQSQDLLDLWDDRRIGAGQDWYQEIQEAMATASVAILLVSANFLTSQFILGEEVPRLLERRDTEGLRIFPVIVKPCAWQTVGWLSRMQVRPKDGRPLSAGDEHQIDADLTSIAEELAAIVDHAAPVTTSDSFASIGPESATSVHQGDQMSKLPQILLDFNSAQSLRALGVEEDNDLLALEYDTVLGKRVLMKRGREFEPGVMLGPFDWRFLHYELVVWLSPESYIYMDALDKTGESHPLVYSSAAIPGLNRYENLFLRFPKASLTGPGIL
jgi:hypothetical protein